MEFRKFSLEEFKKDPTRRVWTRDGRQVRIICTDANLNGIYDVVALIESRNGEYNTYGIYDENGESVSGCSASTDLVFVAKKVEKWINLYRSCTSGCYYDTEAEAEENATSDVVATVKVEWYE